MRVFQFRLAAGLLLALAVSVQAANTVQDFTAIFQPPVACDDNWPNIIGTDPVFKIDGWDGQAALLTEEIASQNNNGIALKDYFGGAWESVQIDFQMTISPGNNSGADGVGFAFADTGFHCGTAMPTWGIGEEPNLTGSLGVGFDTFNNADQGDGGENSVSLHFDGARIDSIPLDNLDLFTIETGNVLQASIVATAVQGGANVTVVLTDLDDGITEVLYDNENIPGFNPYPGRAVFRARTGGANSEQVVDNVSISYTPAGGGQALSFTQDFENDDIEPDDGGPGPGDQDIPPVIGGTPFTLTQAGSVPGPTIINDGNGDGVQPGHLQITEEVGSQHNFVAFDQTSDDTSRISASFDIRILDRGSGRADGMGFVLASTDDYGEDGELTPGAAPWNPAEDPNIAGGLGIGFDTFDNDEEGDEFRVLPEDETGCGGIGSCADRVANHVSLHWDGAEVIEGVRFDLDELDLGSGDWHNVNLIAEEVDGGMLVSLVLVDGADGSVHVAYADELIADAKFAGGARAAFGARTGGAMDFQSVDNILITYGSGDPCDFDGDGSLGIGDVDLLLGEVKAGTNNAAFDVTGDNLVNQDDINFFIGDESKLHTYIGDVNLDGEFNSSDLVQVFQVGKYETGQAAGWGDGDFTGDGLFDSGDLVAAFQDGGFELGPKWQAVASVPEPGSLVLFALGVIGLAYRARRKS